MGETEIDRWKVLGNVLLGLSLSSQLSSSRVVICGYWKQCVEAVTAPGGKAGWGRGAMKIMPTTPAVLRGAGGAAQWGARPSLDVAQRFTQAVVAGRCGSLLAISLEAVERRYVGAALLMCAQERFHRTGS